MSFASGSYFDKGLDRAGTMCYDGETKSGKDSGMIDKFIDSPLCRNGQEARRLLILSKDRVAFDITTRVLAEKVAKIIVTDGIDCGIFFLKGVWYVSGSNDPKMYDAIEKVAAVLGLSLKGGDLSE